MRPENIKQANGDASDIAIKLIYSRDDDDIIKINPPNETMNLPEQNSISALVEYVVFTRKVTRKNTLLLMREKFGASDISALPSKLYDDVVRFLVDFCSEEALKNNGAAND